MASLRPTKAGRGQDVGEARQEGHLGQQSHKRGGLNEGGHLAEDKSGGLLCLRCVFEAGK